MFFSTLPVSRDVNTLPDRIEVLSSPSTKPRDQPFHMQLEELGLQNPISVGYYDPFSIYALVKNDLEAKFPLTNLHWKYHPLKPVKLIPVLPVKMVEEVPHRASKANQEDVHENIYLRLIFVKADNLEIYRAQVRPLIQAWLTDLVEAKKVSWAIVLFTPTSQKDKSLSLIKKSIHDKLVVDFGKNGKHQTITTQSDLEEVPLEDDELVFRIKELYSSDIEKLETYNNMATEFKNLILRTFDRRYNSYNEELDNLSEPKNKNSEALIRQLYFKLKLMDIVSDMRFLDESLKLYESINEDLKLALQAAGHAFKKSDHATFESMRMQRFNTEKATLSRDLLAQFNAYISQGVPVNLQLTKFNLFLGASLLLQSLANSAPELSLSSKYILHLFQRVINFINEILESQQDSFETLEWLFSLTDHYLKLQLTKKLVERGSSEESNAINPLTGILEYMGELRLLQRFIAGRIASLKGLDPPDVGYLFEEVSLDDGNSASNSKSREVKLHNEPLRKALESQESYDSFYEELTVAVIQDFANCGRGKTVDLLSVELAVLHYKKQDFKQAYEILLNSYEYFIENGWSFMGGLLLEIYINCLEKLDSGDHLHILDTNMKLLSTFKEEASKVSDINKYNIVKGADRRMKLLNHVYEIAPKVTELVTYPLETLFNTSLSPFIESVKNQSGVYKMDLEITNNLAIDLDLEVLALELEELSTFTPYRITFTGKDIKLLSSPKQIVSLYTSDFKQTHFKPSKLTYKPRSNLEFIQLFQDPTTDQIDGNGTVVHNKSLTNVVPEEANTANSLGISIPVPADQTDNTIYMYGDSRFLCASFRVPEKIELNASEIEIVINLGNEPVKDVRVQVQALDSGVALTEESNSFLLSLIGAHETHIQRVPYKYFGDSKVLSFAASITYSIGKEQRKHFLQDAVDTSLRILISVQDVFRADSIYSKFQIGCAHTKMPIRVTDVDFRCNENKYDVATLSCDVKDSNPHVVFGEQPAFMFYRITPHLGKVASSDTLDLTIKYSSLQKECEALIIGLHEDYFQSFELQQYSSLFIELVGLLQFELNEYALSNVIQIKNVDFFKSRFRDSIDRNVRSEKDKAELICCVDGIVKECIQVEEPKFVNQELYIPVAVPVLDILHAVEFSYTKQTQFLVGEPIEMKLTISSTFKWSEMKDCDEEVLASSSPAGKRVEAKSQKYQFVIHHEDNWLLSGLKKHAFTVQKPNSNAEFALTLIPLNVGKLPLPRVTIKPLEEGIIHRVPSTDTVHENGLETVLVVPELQSITFSF